MATGSRNPITPQVATVLAIDPVAKNAFWIVVEECLVNFHQRSPLAAITEARAYRRRVENAATGVSGDLIYHVEPFYAACNIAGLVDIPEQEHLLKAHRSTYDAILAANDW